LKIHPLDEPGVGVEAGGGVRCGGMESLKVFVKVGGEKFKVEGLMLKVGRVGTRKRRKKRNQADGRVKRRLI
jgi:hypothetical protein